MTKSKSKPHTSKPRTKATGKVADLRKLREAKAAKPASKPAKAKAKPPGKKPATKPVKSLADLRAALPPTPRPDQLRPDTIALNLLLWDTAELESGKVASIASSYRETGTQISRITIRPAGKKFRVVAGRHRCEAAKAAGWTELKYELLPYVTAADKLTAELIEIDENLCRKNLTPATEAALTARRKAIYEKLHPETRAGVAQAAGMNAARGRQNGNDVGEMFGEPEKAEAATRFTSSTAATAGRSERSVQRAASRGEAIGADNLTRIAHTSLDKGEELDALARLDPAERKDVIERAAAGEKVSAKNELKKQTRATKERELGGLQLALPDKKYGVIVADPEWRFEPWSRETGMSRAADNHYPTSCTEVIAARDVPSIAADDCVLFLWATAPMLPQAVLVMAAWGFHYKTHLIWHKVRNGNGRGSGYWVTGEHELLLIGTKGKVVAPATAMCGSLFASPWQGDHSAKPDFPLEVIEREFPTLPKIELNRRGPARAGWDAWGNEAVPDEAAPTEPATNITENITELTALETIDNERPLDPEWLAKLKAEKFARGSVKPTLTKLGTARLNKLRLEKAAAIERDEWQNEVLPADMSEAEIERTVDSIQHGVLNAIDAGEKVSKFASDACKKAGLITVGSRGKFELTDAGRAQREALGKKLIGDGVTDEPSQAELASLNQSTEITVDCRVCADGNGICAQCLPAESHVVSMTNDLDEHGNHCSYATCICGWKHAAPWGDHHEAQEAAVKAHWQSVVDEARASELVDEAACPGHVASEGDPKVCGRCGLHIDSLRPDEELEGDGLGIPAFLQREPAEVV